MSDEETRLTAALRLGKAEFVLEAMLEYQRIRGRLSKVTIEDVAHTLDGLAFIDEQYAALRSGEGESPRFCPTCEHEWLDHGPRGCEVRYAARLQLEDGACSCTACQAEARSEGLDAARPEIVVLCGSTRFYDMFQAANYDLTMLGKIVLSVGFYPHSKAIHGHGEGVGHDSAEKVALDELHKRKIDLADRVYVLNVGGYIGESTRSEIDYAIAHGKPIDYLEPAALSQHKEPNRG